MSHVEGVGGGVVGDAVAGDFLIEHAARHSGALEGHMITAGKASSYQLLDAQFLEDRQFALDHRFQLRTIGPTQAGHFAGAGVMDDAGGDARQLRFMLLDIGIRAEQPLLLAGEQNKSECAFGRCAASGQLPGGFQDHGDAGAIVQSALPQVPRVEVRTQDDDLVGFFRTANFTHRVVDGHRARNELVTDFNLDASARRRRTGG